MAASPAPPKKAADIAIRSARSCSAASSNLIPNIDGDSAIARSDEYASDGAPESAFRMIPSGPPFMNPVSLHFDIRMLRPSLSTYDETQWWF